MPTRSASPFRIATARAKTLGVGAALLLLALAVLLFVASPTRAQFLPNPDPGTGPGEGPQGAGDPPEDGEGGSGDSGSGTIPDSSTGGSNPNYNNGGFDIASGMSTGYGSGQFGSLLPDYPPVKVNFTDGQCQIVPKWPGPRCPAGTECVSEILEQQAVPNDGKFSLTYRQEQCVFCFVTDFCTQAQRDACQKLDVLEDTDTADLVNITGGLGYCRPCKEGQYCPYDPNTNAQASNPFGLAIVNLCTEGFYCPTPAQEVICREGFFCPPGTKYPFACTVTGTYCDAGSTSAVKLCPGGSYCPNPQTKIQCPRGYFCKQGSTEPRKCQALAACPPGSAAALIVWQGILEVCALYAAMGLLYWFVLFIQKRRRKRELERIAARTQGKEVVELLRSLKTFQALEAREGDAAALMEHEAFRRGGHSRAGSISKYATPRYGAARDGLKPNDLAALEAATSSAGGELVIARTLGDDIALVRMGGSPKEQADRAAENMKEDGAVETNRGQMLPPQEKKGLSSRNTSQEKDDDPQRPQHHEPVVVGVFSNPHKSTANATSNGVDSESVSDAPDATTLASELKSHPDHPYLSKLLPESLQPQGKRKHIEVILPPTAAAVVKGREGDHAAEGEHAVGNEALLRQGSPYANGNGNGNANGTAGGMRKSLPVSMHLMTDEDAPSAGGVGGGASGQSSAAAGEDVGAGAVGVGARSVGAESEYDPSGPAFTAEDGTVIDTCETDSDDDDEHDDLDGFDPVPVPISLSFEKLGLKLKNGVEILKGVSGEFPHSRLTALMGPSGSGKSSFLNVLCGKATYGSQTGVIRINGVESTMSAIKSLTGFVPQDDVMHGDLTPYENLYYNAMLRLPRAMPQAQKKQIIADTIAMLGLEAVQHTVVGVPEARGISGGQRKRVNIGLEISAWPYIVFLDEPTSGLDSTASLEVLSSLRDLTTLGMSIVAVIHQPRFSIVELFHSMLLLGKGGQTVFLGSSEQALNYFSNLGFVLPPNENPADFFLDVISGEVRREGDPDFQPSDLFELWAAQGEWVRQGEIAPPGEGSDDTLAASSADASAPAFHSESPEEAEASVNGNGLHQRQASAQQQRFVAPPALIVTPTHNNHLGHYFRNNNPLSTRQYSGGAFEASAPPTAVAGGMMSTRNGAEQPLQRFATMHGTGGGVGTPRLPPAAGGMDPRSQTVGGGGEENFMQQHQQGGYGYGYGLHSVRMPNGTGNGGLTLQPNAAAAHHRRTRSLYNAMSAYRAGVKDASELPLPKHRELLNKFGKEGIGKLLQEYREAAHHHHHGHSHGGAKHGKDKDSSAHHQHHFSLPFSFPFSTKHSNAPSAAASRAASPQASAASSLPGSAAPTPHPSGSMPQGSPRDVRARMLHKSSSTRRLNMLFDRQPSARNLNAPAAAGQQRGVLMRTGSMHQLQTPHPGNGFGFSNASAAAAAAGASARASHNPYHHANFLALTSPASRSPHTPMGMLGAYGYGSRQRSSNNGNGASPAAMMNGNAAAAEYYYSAFPPYVYDPASVGAGGNNGMVLDWPANVAKLKSPIVAGALRSPGPLTYQASAPAAAMTTPAAGMLAVDAQPPQLSATPSGSASGASGVASPLRRHPSAGSVTAALGGIEEEEELSPPALTGAATTGATGTTQPAGAVAPVTRAARTDPSPSDNSSLQVHFHSEDDAGAKAFSKAAGDIILSTDESVLRSSSLPVHSSFGGPSLSEIPSERGASDGAGSLAPPTVAVVPLHSTSGKKGKRLPPHLHPSASLVDVDGEGDSTLRFKYHHGNGSRSPSSSSPKSRTSELGDDEARLAAALTAQASKLNLPLGDVAVMAAALEQVDASEQGGQALGTELAHKGRLPEAPASSTASTAASGSGGGMASSSLKSDTDVDDITMKKTNGTTDLDGIEMVDLSKAQDASADEAVAFDMSSSPASLQLPPEREVPWIAVQFLYLLQRQGLKLMRSVNHVIFDMLLTTAVGLAIGLIFGGVWSLSAYGNISVLGVLSLGVLSCVSALKCFGNDRLVFWRESSAGISIVAYWLAVTLLHLPFTLIFSFLFVAPYFNLILPDVSFQDTWFVFIGVHFACSGGGMLLSVAFAPLTALLSGVMLPLIIGGFLNGVSPALVDMSSTLRFFADISYSRYGVEALMLQEFAGQPDYADPLVDNVNKGIGFNMGEKDFAIGMLFVIGAVLRAATLLALFTLNRDKRV